MPRSGIHEILSGRRKGFWPSLLRGFLFFLSMPYALAVAVRNRLYDWKLKTVRCLDCRVIAVGNITAGGTGKTPLVEYLAEYVLARTPRVAIVSRGYGAGNDESNDEKLMLCENLPDVPHVAGADRYACGLIAQDRHDAHVVIMDDAFQHRRVGRDLDIVTLDATNPFGYGYLLPRGLLREPPAALARADDVVVTRARLVEKETLDALEREIRRHAPDVLICQAEEQVTSIVRLDGQPREVDEIRGKRVAAFCGLGNPEAFRCTLKKLDIDAEPFLLFDDHHRYTESDFRAIDAAASAENTEVILTTHKDRVKLPDGYSWTHDVLVVRIKLVLTKNEDELKRKIDEVIGSA
jgi:tetraacyldisaccharide 4'-kinase